MSPELINLLKNYKKEHNEFYVKRRLFLKNKRKAKNFAKSVRQKLPELGARDSDDEDDDNNSDEKEIDIDESIRLEN